MIRFTALFFCLLLAGCASPDVGPPPVDLDELAPLMADLQLAEALSTELPIVVRDSVRQVYFDRVMEDHNTNRAAFDSITWLVRQEPIWIDSLYNKVAVILAEFDVPE